MEKILITGGCGFLGQHLIHELLEDGAPRIKVLDLQDNKHKLYDFSDKVEYVLGKDIRDFNGIEDEFKNIDVVFHLAAFVSFLMAHKEQMFEVNVSGTRNVLQSSLENNVKRVIHISSATALGFTDDEGELLNEESKFNLEKASGNYYSISKYKGELSALEYVNRGLNCTIANPGSMYGPGDVSNSSRMIKSIKEGTIPFNIPGGVNVIDVRDVAKGLLKILKKGKRGEKYFLTGRNYSLREINCICAECIGTKPPKCTLPKIFCKPACAFIWIIEKVSRKLPQFTHGLTYGLINTAFMTRYCDNSKARRELDWEPIIPFKQTIRDAYTWLNENHLV